MIHLSNYQDIPNNLNDVNHSHTPIIICKVNVRIIIIYSHLLFTVVDMIALLSLVCAVKFAYWKIDNIP